MRPFPGAVLALALAALPLRAQSFAGTATLRFPRDSVPAPQLLQLAVRGERWHATLMDEKRHLALLMMLFDRSTRLVREGRYVLGKQVEGFATEPAGVPTPAPVEMKPLGKTRKIEGVECADHAFEAAGRALQGCFTRALGRFFAPVVQSPVRMDDDGFVWSLGLPGWALALSESELFPLKVWDEKGRTLLELRSIEREKQPFCFFTLPPSIRTDPDPKIAATSFAAYAAIMEEYRAPSGCALIRVTEAAR